MARVTRERDELAQLMDEVGEGLMALTDDARVLRINPAARQLLGLAQVVPFSPVGSIVRDPVLRDLLELSVVRPEARMEVRVGDRELEVRTKRGTEGGAVVLLVDITEIRRLEAVRSDFVANASHELKTPLTVIRAAAETVLDEELAPDLRAQFLRSIENNTVRLQRLVDDLLDLSRYESGAWQPEREPLDVAAVAWSAWDDMEDAWTGLGIDFQVNGLGDAIGDEAAVYQVFRNLFENALRYVGADMGRIAVHISLSAHHLVVAVEDNGSGHPRVGPAPHLRALLPRGHGAVAAGGRHRPGAGDRAASGVEHGGAGGRQECLGRGDDHHLHRAFGSGGAGVTAMRGDELPRERRRRMAPKGRAPLAGRPVRAGRAAAVAACSVLLGACVGGDLVGGGARVVRVGGSSSLAALSEAVAEDFAAVRPSARVIVTGSGSGRGIRDLCSGRLDIAGASRPILSVEAALCAGSGVTLASLPIARDGVAVVVHPDNAAAGCLTLDELARLWAPGSTVTTWQDLRPALPRTTIRLFGPGPGSGTFDFFTRIVVGRAGAGRADHYQTDHDHLVARGVAGHRWALGYLGSALLVANRQSLRPVAVDTGFGCVPPTREAVSSGAYSPLSRDLHLHVSHAALARPEVRDFARHYAASAERLTIETGHVPLAPAEYARTLDVLASVR